MNYYKIYHISVMNKFVTFYRAMLDTLHILFNIDEKF